MYSLNTESSSERDNSVYLYINLKMLPHSIHFKLCKYYETAFGVVIQVDGMSLK